MPAKKAAKPAARPAKKAAPRTRGTPSKPPAPRKVAAPARPKAPAPAKRAAAAPRAAPAKRAPRAPSRPAPTRPAAPQGAPETADPWGWAQVPPTPAAAPEPEWIPVPAPPLAPRPVRAFPPPPPARTGWADAPLAFDPATGLWLPGPDVVAEVPPEAYRKGATRSILLNVLLGLTLGFFALNLLAQIAIGIALLAAPDSEFANDIQEYSQVDSPWDIIANQLLTFLLVGVVPFLWVLGTRVVPWLGTKRFLRLRATWKDWLRGVALVPAMIAAVWVLLVGYTCAVEGCDALTQEAEPEDGSGLDAMLQNLNWPVVIVISLCAGIGEEILFRGVLQRWMGIWGQGIVFGLAHAGNAYPPQVIFAFGLGVVFGYLYRRGWSLVTLMVAHTLYDFTLLVLALYGLG